MHIGVTLPNHRGIDDVDAVVAIGSLAEEMQFDSVWASDHLLNDSYIEKRIGQRPYYSPLACLTYLAGVTKSIRLGTSVLTLPLYPPVELAKSVATLDQLSHGRVILGVGAGGIPSEYEASRPQFPRPSSIARRVTRRDVPGVERASRDALNIQSDT
jgi:alkanesulfonate monooxygenase SsuD/methylene tetrahydromethanopterin reductase-like flavin-dependent oxidoreductase (luciferase family)